MNLKLHLWPLLPLVLLAFSSAQAQTLEHQLGQYIIKTYTPPQQLALKHREFQGHATRLRMERVLSGELSIYLFSFDHTQIHEERFLAALRNDPAIHTAQYNHLISYRLTPNDTEFDNQWQYINVGQSGGTQGADIDAEQAWDLTTGGLTPFGDTIVAAVIDEGFDWEHQDFGDNIWYNYEEIPNDGIDNDNNGYVDDYRGWNAYNQSDNITGGWHGTSVAGIIGAKGNNNLGVTGVNWNVKLMIIQGGGDEAEAIAAYSYCYAQRKRYNESGGQNGAYVVTTNASWGTNFGQASDAPLWCSFYDTLGLAGIVSCGATANSNTNVDVDGDLPTSCTSDYLISVTNMNHFDEKVTGAGYGATSIDLGAFGQGTWTTDLGNTYGEFGGTSGATPHVAGTVALMHATACPSFTAFAKANPGAAALQIKQYILDGTDPNPTLNGVTVTGGRLNVYNSVNAVVTNCDPSSCFSPYSITFGNVTDTSFQTGWSVGDETTQSNLRYRVAGTDDWTVAEDATPAHTFSGLTPCTEYEMQAQAVCGMDTTDWGLSMFVETDGCCTPPQGFSISNITENEAHLEWGPILAATGYEIRYKAIEEATWTDVPLDTLAYNLSGLAACTNYEVQIRSVCTDSTFSDYSATYPIPTLGCGACADADYCLSYAWDASSEWMESVEFNTIDNVSGNNDGYGDFTNISTTVERGMTYDLTMTPGFSYSPFEEWFTAWVDYNQDGDFDDEGEVVHASSVSSAAITVPIPIPVNAVSGATRMRVTINYGTPAMACQENIEYGEVEDYCLNITGDEIPVCDPVAAITITDTTLTTASLDWEDVDNAIGYELRYREVGATDWTGATASSSERLMEELNACVSYELQIRTVCGGLLSDYSGIMTFTPLCDVGVLSAGELPFGIYPNPVADILVVDLAEANAWAYRIIDTNGKVVLAGRSNTDMQALSIGHIPPGLYWLEVMQRDKIGVRKLVKM